MKRTKPLPRTKPLARTAPLARTKPLPMSGGRKPTPPGMKKMSPLAHDSDRDGN